MDCPVLVAATLLRGVSMEASGSPSFHGAAAELALKSGELDCIYRAAKVIAAPECSFDEVLQSVVQLIADGRAGCVGVRIQLEGKEFRSSDWRETISKEYRAIVLRGDQVGSIEVCHLDNNRVKHSRNPLETVALMLAEVVGRRRTEETLRKSEERFREIVENAPSAYFRAGKNGLWEYVNKEWERIQGLPREAVVGTSMKLTRVLRDRWTLEEYQEVRQRALLGETVRSQFEMMRDGEKRHYMMFMQPVHGEHGVVGVEGFIDDITDEKLAAEARAERAAAAARADELKRSRQRVITMEESLRKEMAQRLHGAVQNRLIVVLHGLKELNQTPLPEDASAEVERLGEILKELLDKHVRPISHQLYPSVLRQGLVPALLSLADQFETLFTIETEFNESLEKGERADRNLIPEQTRIAVYRIAEEAFANVLKHADASRVRLKVDLTPDGLLRMSVRDDGCGFDSSNLQSGLGTSLMSDYAGVVDGRCDVISSPGNGTEVAAVFASGRKHPKQETGGG